MEPADIINIIILSICLIAQILIVATGYKQLRHSQSRNELTVIFYCSFVLAFCATLSAMSYTLGQIHLSQRFLEYLIIIPSICFFLWSLLATFVMRLYLSFKGSAFELSKRTVRRFAILLIVEAIFIICFVINYTLWSVDMDTHGFFDFLAVCSVILFPILYFVGSIVSVWLFLKRLSQLTQLQCASQRDLGVSAEDVKLSVNQQKTLDLFAKFLLLFSVGMLSSICLWTFGAMLDLVHFTFPIDLTINLLCLYLQFATAKHHYRICCGWPDSQCTRMVSWRERRAIHKKSLSLRQRPGHSVVHSVSSVATPSSTEEQPKMECTDTAPGDGVAE